MTDKCAICVKAGGVVIQANTENATEQTELSHPLSRVFFGPQGIRAGWSILIFIALFVLFGAGARVLLHFLPHSMQGENTASGIAPLSRNIGELVALGLTLIATAIMARLENRPFPSYGLGGRGKLPLALLGAFWGFFFVSLLVAVLYLTHHLAFDATTLSTAIALKYGAVWLLGMTLVAFFEETLLRGYMQWTLARGIGFWWAALLLSLSFGLLHGHNPGESPIGLVSAGAIGLVLCLSIWYTGSLWWAIGFHTAWDWGESYFYGTPDSGLLVQGHLLTAHPLGWVWMSGGATGPEGSLLILPTIILVALVLFFTLGPTNRWATERSTDL